MARGTPPYACRGLPKHQGAGLYLEVAPGWVWVGGGMYSPDTSQLIAVREHIAGIFRHNPTLRFTTRSLHVGDDFAVCEWTASTGSKEWDGVDVFPLRDGRIARKDVYSSSHRPRELSG